MTLLRILIAIVFLLVMLIFAPILLYEPRERRKPRTHRSDDSA